MIKRVLKALPSVIVVFYGLAIIIGWWARIPMLVMINADNHPIVFNTGLCFLLTGIALFCSTFQTPILKRIQILLGITIFILASLTLCQDLLQINIGIDQLISSTWIEQLTLYPGRMAPNTSIGFILLGLVFVLLAVANIKAAGYAIEAAIFLIFLLGILGITGYILNVEFLYSWSRYTSMAQYAALGFVFLGVFLWWSWRHNPYSAALFAEHEDRKITILSSIILLSISLIVGLATFITLANQQLEFTKNAFQQTFQAKSALLQNEIYRALSEYKAVQDNLLVHPPVFEQNQASSLARLEFAEDFFLAEGFTAASVTDLEGHLISKKGTFAPSPVLEYKLKLPENVVMLWQNGWYLRILSKINLDSTQPRILIAEWPLSAINKSFKDIESIGQTASLSLCGRVTEHEGACFPSRFSPAVTKVSLKDESSQERAMKLALKGLFGTEKSKDLSQRGILSIYGPISNLGLAMVIKVDIAEIYQPITSRLKLVFPVVLIAVLIGLLLLRLEVMPLIRRVFNTEKKLIQSNKLLKNSEERYALAVRGSSAGLWDWEVGTDRIFYSPYLKNMLGYTDEELANSVEEFEQHLHPDDLKRVRAALREHIIDRVPYSVEYRLRRKSGEYHWFHVVGQAQWNADGIANRMAGSISDITDRKVTEQRLGTQYAVTQILSEAMTLDEAVPLILHAICEGLKWDFGALWLANYEINSLCCIGKWSRDEDKTRVLEKASANINFTFGKETLGRVWSSAKPYWIDDIETDKGFLRAESAKVAGLHTAFFFPILLQSSVFGVMEFFSKEMNSPDEKLLQMMAAIGPQVGQFVQRKRFESDLKKSEEQKSAILNAASDSIITINEKGVILSFNLQTEKIFAYSFEDLQQANINKLIPGLIQQADALIGKPPMEFVGNGRKNKEIPIEITVSGMSHEEKRIFVIIIRDITERKKVDTLKSEFISVVSHELRTPLTSIRGSLGLVLGGVAGELAEKAKKLLVIANNNCERLLHLINDILDIEKIEAGKMRFQFAPVDISTVVKESININQMYAAKFDVRIALTDSVNNIQVNVDEDRLVQVLTNLISNAAKFSPKNEIVKVAIKLVNDRVYVSVNDKGPGIPTEFQTRIFQKFSQADATNTRGKGGTGLGLSISKAIIEKFGGRLGFVSTPGKGAEFYFELPIFQAADKKNDTGAPSSLNKKKHLLVCEDDEDQANYLSAMLNAAGFQVDIANTALEAKRLLALKHYQALLLDLILPDQDGIAFIRELRNDNATRKLPIIVLSVIADTGRALMNGDAFSVLDWLDKPVDFSKLLSDVLAINEKNNQYIARILHVEDDEDARKIIEALLQDSAEVDFAVTLQEAKHKLAHQHYDLVILDLILPDGKGTELLPILAKANTPVIVFSAVELDREHAMFVQKAFVKSETSTDKLLETIEKLVQVST